MLLLLAEHDDYNAKKNQSGPQLRDVYSPANRTTTSSKDLKNKCALRRDEKQEIPET